MDGPDRIDSKVVRGEAADEFAAFYSRSVPSLVAFLRWQGASWDDAVDCVQEAVTQCYRGWSTIDHPLAWCRITASRMWQRQLRVARMEELYADPSESGNGLPLVSPNGRFDVFEQHQTVMDMLDRLPFRQRQVMAWTYAGATPTEIAAALQINSNAVRANLKKARAALRERLRDIEKDTEREL